MTEKTCVRIEDKFCRLLGCGFHPRIFAYSKDWAVEVCEEATDRFVLRVFDIYGQLAGEISVSDSKVMNARVKLAEIRKMRAEGVAG